MVSAEQLLLRLTHETGAVQRKLVELFIPSYMPHSESGGTQLSRCVALCRENPAAALSFYAGVFRWVPIGAASGSVMNDCGARGDL